MKFVLTGLSIMLAILVNAQIENLKPPPRTAPYVAKRKPTSPKPINQPQRNEVTVDDKKEDTKIAKLEKELREADDAYENGKYEKAVSVYLKMLMILTVYKC